MDIWKWEKSEDFYVTCYLYKRASTMNEAPNKLDQIDQTKLAK